MDISVIVMFMIGIVVIPLLTTGLAAFEQRQDCDRFVLNISRVLGIAAAVITIISFSMICLGMSRRNRK